MSNSRQLASAVTFCVAASLSASALAKDAWPGGAGKLSVVVMDPLAAPLSCPCVEGYAQRDYERFAEFLKDELGVEVKLAFAATLAEGHKKAGGADIIIGKQSVVESDLKALKLRASPKFRLTDMQGSTTQNGLIVVNRADPAKRLSDLKGYTIIFGSASSKEKHDAALALLTKSKIKVPQKLREIDEACSDGACKVIDLGPESRTAAVISSYAQPLLEGCGKIRKGDLRVVGKTAPVPFVTAFFSAKLTKQQAEAVSVALGGVKHHPDVLEALESLIGFVEVAEKTAPSDETVVEKSITSAAKKKKLQTPVTRR
ncbi:MAG TPA: hypothetical protein DDW52_08880 [Planctomycetaceae bacterium]|nr:hypothetical protein [Planctomycetaceae bacterium]